MPTRAHDRLPHEKPAFAQVLPFLLVRLCDCELARLAPMPVEPFEIAQGLHFDAMVGMIEELAVELTIAASNGPEMFSRTRLARWRRRTVREARLRFGRAVIEC
jgi:hypothetical protein